MTFLQARLSECFARVTEHRSCCFASRETEAWRRGDFIQAPNLQQQSPAPCAPPAVCADLSRSGRSGVLTGGEGAGGGKEAAWQAKEKISDERSSFPKEKHLQRTAQPGLASGKAQRAYPALPACRACPGEGRSLQGPSPFPPGTAHLPPAIIPPGFPQRRISAAGVSSPAMPPEPAVYCLEVLAGSADEFPLGTLSARGVQCIFLP